VTTRVHRCSDFREHEAEAFLLSGACVMGTFEAAGLIVERCSDCECVAGVWKVMRCGCTFVAEFVGAS